MKPNLKRIIRQTHYWLSLAIVVPAAVMFMAGSLLMLKKQVDWIQPPTQIGAAPGDMPQISFTQMLEAAQSHPEAQIDNWNDIDRIDIRIDKGIAKLQANSGWEVQIDIKNGDILSVAFRRSDLIEQIHDGSFFSSFAKFFVFLPTGILLIIMWGSGVYLFVLPRVRKKRS